MRQVIRRIIALIPAFILQAAWILLLAKWFAPYSAVLNFFLSLLAILYVFFIINNRSDGTYKTLWLIVIMGFPIFGSILYMLLGNKNSSKPLQKKLKTVEKVKLPDIDQSEAIERQLSLEAPRVAQSFRYVWKKTGFPIRQIKTVEYFPIGEALFARMLEEMERAEHYIYAEYFIIAEGKMWDAMVEIMARKVQEGVDVRVMYDDLGSIATYAKKNVSQLKEKGIHCIAFNPIVFVKGVLNYRDHRKMLIVDGRIAFSGGVNLSDEYINEKELFGHWKDIGFCVTGAGVWNYTKMFLDFWNAFSKEKVMPSESFETDQIDAPEKQGYILSYYDSPLYPDAVSNNLYIDLLGQAVDYAWFYTPYLMLGEELLTAFVQAAERGVDVRLIIPGIPDKKLVYRMSRSYYSVLLNAGVRIFEYKPGFVHAKACVIDDKIGCIGTVNLDYRSLFLHFENNALFYNAPLLMDLKKDFSETQEKCRERKSGDTRESFGKWITDSILKLFAPLC